MHHFAVGGNLVADIPLHAQLQSPIGRMALSPMRRIDESHPFASQMGEARVNAWLRNPALAETIDIRLEKFSPPQEIAEHKGDLSWSEWIRLDPDKGGITPKQQQQLLEWNLEEMKRRNRTDGPALEAQIDSYGVSLCQTVAEGTVDPAIKKEWHKAQPRLTALVKPPLPLLPFRGEAHQKYKLFLVDSVNDFTTDHEITHILGGIHDTAGNEPITDILTHSIAKLPEAIPELKSTYVFGGLHLLDIFAAANMNIRDLSRYFAGTNPKQNQRSMQKALKSSSGHDVLGDYIYKMHREQRHLRRCVKGIDEGSTLLLASIRVLQQARGITFEETVNLVPEPQDDPGINQKLVDFLHRIYPPRPDLWNLGYPPGRI